MVLKIQMSRTQTAASICTKHKLNHAPESHCHFSVLLLQVENHGKKDFHRHTQSPEEDNHTSCVDMVGNVLSWKLAISIMSLQGSLKNSKRDHWSDNNRSNSAHGLSHGEIAQHGQCAHTTIR